MNINEIFVSLIHIENGRPYVDGDDGKEFITPAVALEALDFQEKSRAISPKDASAMRAKLKPQRGTGHSSADTLVKNDRGDVGRALDEVVARARVDGEANMAALGEAMDEYRGALPQVAAIVDPVAVMSAARKASQAAQGTAPQAFASAPVAEAKTTDDGLNAAEVIKKSITARPLARPPVQDDLKGQPAASAWIQKQLSAIRSYMERGATEETSKIRLGAVIMGPESVGRRLTAAIYAEELKQLGIVKDAVPQIIDIRQLIEDGIKIPDVLGQIKGGVVLLENTDALDPEQDATTIKLIADMAKSNTEPVIILSGSPDLRGKVNNHWRLTDDFGAQVELGLLPADVMLDIFVAEATRMNLTLDDKARAAAFGRLRSIREGTAKDVGRLLAEAERRMAERLYPNGRPPPDHPDAQIKGALLADDLRVESPFDVEGNLKSRKRLDTLRGQEHVKEYCDALIANAKEGRIRQGEGKRVPLPNLNMTLEGPPGVGKTTVVRMVHDIEVDLGYRSGAFVYVTAAELMVGTPGEITRRVRALFNEALNGSFVIDEAHQLFNNDNGKLVLDALLPLMYNHRETTTTRLIGYDLKRILSHDPGMVSRIPDENRIKVEGLKRPQLGQVFVDLMEKAEYELAPETPEAALRSLDVQRASKDFGNARAVENTAQAATTRRNIRVQAERKAAEEAKKRGEELAIETRILGSDVGTTGKTPVEMLDELKRYVNFEHIYDRMETMALNAADESRDESALGDLMSPYFTIVGDEGTGRKSLLGFKTRLLNAMAKVGTSKPEIKPALDFKAQFEGQTPAHVRAIFEEHLGKVLGVTGIHEIMGDRGYGVEVASTLASLMDEYKGRIVISFLLTPEQLATVKESQSALKKKVMSAESYRLKPMDAAAATTVLVNMLEDKKKKVTDEAQKLLEPMFAGLIGEDSWSNGSTVEDVTRQLIATQLGRARKGQGSADIIDTGTLTAVIQAMTGDVPEWAKSLPIKTSGKRMKAMADKPN